MSSNDVELITKDGRYPVDLTGPQSHILVIEPGAGSLSIGPASPGKMADLHVTPAERIEWSVFNPFATPGGSPWPRVLRYTGSDTGFFDWASTRLLEEMVWIPFLPADATIDARRSNVPMACRSNSTNSADVCI